MKNIVIAQEGENAITEEPPDTKPVQDSEEDAGANSGGIAKSPALWCTPFGLSGYPRPHRSVAELG